MAEKDVSVMSKEQLIGIVKDQGEKITALEAKIKTATDFIDGVRAGQAKANSDEDGDWV